MKRSLISMGLAAVLAMPGPSSVLADSISEIEGARANERAGRGLTAREVDQLNRYGGNDDGYRYYRRYDDGYYDQYAYGGSGYIRPPRHRYVEPGYHDDGPYDDDDDSYDDHYDDDYDDDDYDDDYYD